MANPTFSERLQSLAEPGIIYASASYHFISVLLETVFKRGELLAPFLRMSKIRDEAFSKFWIKFSGARDTSSPTIPAPPPTGSSALIPPLLSLASGIVLDIGPGTGTQTPLFTNPNLLAMYGAEPCLGLHADLRAKIESSDHLAGKYHILPCSAEPEALVPALEKVGLFPLKVGDSNSRNVISEGIFDTIVCVRVLCSVPNPQSTIRGLYSLLKPGGKLLVCEHVVNPWQTRKGSVVARVLQGVYEAVGWRWVMGDCRLGRDTEGMLRSVTAVEGEEKAWESVELERDFGWSCIPYISGVLVKRR
ncbi:hypothetical protein AJ80_08368 [Polytolypa hystricis UAMH7299]|uniref:Methyltransferase type 11 domain-containing protein n=1 Tax=Polytolypa hystricis (strain UAMH7299) TaxID=1447883 RepID=A0A2B7X8Q7_POLH7|nr:hypothetical protein AJ80_08368 [Polytolypa hystricis UAMH7299]